MSQQKSVGGSDDCYLSKCTIEEFIYDLRNNKKSWVDDAIADVISYLYYDNLLKGVVQAIIEDDPLEEPRPIDDMALELEALAVVVASVRAKLFGIAVKTCGINVRDDYGYLLYNYIRQEREEVIHYNVRFRFRGDLYRPEVEFLYVNSGSAGLSLRVTPAGWPPTYALRSARRIIWKAVKSHE
jgi:hypothetical protein